MTRDLLTWSPFHRDEWPPSIARPEEFRGGARVRASFDLGRLDGREKKRAIEAWCEWLPRQSGIRWLSLWSHVTQPLFDATCRVPGLECLEIKWSNVTSLEGMTGMSSLQYLSMGSSTRVESIAPLASLSALRLLSIENFARIHDFSPLTELRALESLSVTGSMWTRQDVGGVAPFAQMTWLRHLALDTAKVSGIQPLAALSNLELLEVGGRLPMQEYAQLAARMPNTRCRWFHPYLALEGSGMTPCERCRRDSKVMVTGKGGPVLCKHCDAQRLQRYVARFEQARASAPR